MFRIGCGAGFSSDRLEPAVDLVERGNLDCIVFECVGERTLAFGHRDRMRDASKGYNSLLEHRMRKILPACARHGTQIITNMGVANPRAAAEVTYRIAQELGLKGLRVVCVEGDDVTADLQPDTTLWEGGLLRDVQLTLVGANAYLGIDALRLALDADPHVVITGRMADPSLFLAPLARHYGWAGDAWNLLGAGTLVGHLLECSAQISGGYFADPGYKDVSNVAYCGFPLAEVEPNGAALITKLSATGGLVSVGTVKEQMLYEVHDPSRYLTPDVTADFSRVAVADQGTDRVSVTGAGGGERPPQLKVTVGFDGGFLGEAGISYAGPGAQARAQLARAIVAERMKTLHEFNGNLRLDIIGVDSLHGTAREYPTDSQDVRLRGALRSVRRDDAELLLWELEALLVNGPAGGGGYRGSITPSVVTYSASLDRAAIRPHITVFDT